MPRKKSEDNKPEDTQVKTVKRTRRKNESGESSSVGNSRPRAGMQKSSSPVTKIDEREKIFALDIGTRSVIGIVAALEDNGNLTIIATHREEHKTRAMLDGQIHDVPRVAAVIKSVKKELEKQVGTLKSAAVAAAGRALYTVTATSEVNIEGIVTYD